MAGQLMDFQVGFSMMSMFDPISNENVTLLGTLLYWVSMVMFFVVDGHHMLIRAIIDSFNVVDIGKFILIARNSYDDGENIYRVFHTWIKNSNTDYFNNYYNRFKYGTCIKNSTTIKCYDFRYANKNTSRTQLFCSSAYLLFLI